MPDRPEVDHSLATRAVAAHELGAFFTMLSGAFGEETNDDEVAAESLTVEPERTLAVFDGDEIVGTAGAFSFDLAVPGGRLPAAGVTYVGVRATHRRRGILSSLMRRQLHDVHQRGEPVAVLWASEAAIYGRFGYGLATQLIRVEVDRVDATVRSDLARDDGLRLRQVAPGEAVKDIERIERAVIGRRPGQFVRDHRWIELLIHDSESRRAGMSRLQCLLAVDGDDVQGYVLYRTKPDSLRPHMLPNGDVLVVAQSAVSPAARVALTRAVLSMDLMRRVRWWNLPVDTSLPHLLADPRQARTTVVDATHLRVVDVREALARRRYLLPVDAVIDIADEVCPWNGGRWHLRGDASHAMCDPTDAEPALRLSVETLGAAYLGGTALTTLAEAGRVDAADGATLTRVSNALRWDVAPWCPVIF